MTLQINKSKMLAENEGSSVKAKCLYIIIHDTATPNAPAVNVATYEKRTWNDAYVHFAVDWDEIYQIGTPGYVSWGALDANPYAPVQIELCNTTDQNEFDRSYKNYIALAREMADKFGIPKILDAGGAGTPGLKTHKWVSDNIGGDHQDPYAYLASHGISKEQFARDLANGINGEVSTGPVNGGGSTAPSKPDNSSSAKINDDGYLITPENGTFTPQAGLRVFNYPGINDTNIKTDGVPFEYFGYIRNDNAGYLYVATHEFGMTRYVACRELSTGQALGTFE